MTTFAQMKGWRTVDNRLRCRVEGWKPRHPKDYAREGTRLEEAATLRELQERAEEARHQILFPMVVGVIFVAVLIVGALFG